MTLVIIINSYMNRYTFLITILTLLATGQAQANNIQGNAFNINPPTFPSFPNISPPTLANLIPDPPTFPSFPNISPPTLPNLIPGSNACTGNCGWNTIDVNGAATLNVNPDIASLNVQVSANGKTTADAINLLAQKINKVLSTLTSIGLNSNNWQTNSLSVYPNSSYINGNQVVYGQIASQSMSVTIPLPNSNGSTLGKIYDGLAQISDITINSLNFDLQDKTSSYVQARKLAYDNAVLKAKDYTNAAGVTLQSPLTVTDSFSIAPVATPYARDTPSLSAFKVAVPTTVSVGTIVINYNVAVAFLFA